jgi:hypothetical protein
MLDAGRLDLAPVVQRAPSPAFARVRSTSDCGESVRPLSHGRRAGVKPARMTFRAQVPPGGAMRASVVLNDWTIAEPAGVRVSRFEKAARQDCPPQSNSVHGQVAASGRGCAPRNGRSNNRQCRRLLLCTKVSDDLRQWRISIVDAAGRPVSDATTLIPFLRKTADIQQEPQGASQTDPPSAGQIFGSPPIAGNTVKDDEQRATVVT